MTKEELESIKAEHERTEAMGAPWCLACGGFWPCLPYRLADAALAEQQRADAAEAKVPSAEWLTAWLHRRNQFDYDECQHGTYLGGPTHGQPYAMCERQGSALAEALAALDSDQPALKPLKWDQAAEDAWNEEDK